MKMIEYEGSQNVDTVVSFDSLAINEGTTASVAVIYLDFCLHFPCSPVGWPVGSVGFGAEFAVVERNFRLNPGLLTVVRCHSKLLKQVMFKMTEIQKRITC